jgi:phosphate transport system substrate-binding protein
MKTLVMKGRPMIGAPDLLIGSLMSSTILQVGGDVQGIGYSVYYYHEFLSPSSSIKACAIDGALPTSETIRSRRYPFVAEVFIVVRRDLAPDHPALRLRDWMLGPTGQGFVEESGYVPVREPPKSPPR